MKDIIEEIFKAELNEPLRTITQIEDLGSVNTVFNVKGLHSDYIIRLNDAAKDLEYKKEKWCLENVFRLGIPSPKIISQGFRHHFLYMIQEKIVGLNGKLCDAQTKLKIWNTLGEYAKQYQNIARIADIEVEANEFHKDWKARLIYNIKELNKEDSLVKNEVLTRVEQTQAIKELNKLIAVDFKTGLVHGDLCPRNVIHSEETVCLLDWGTAEINVVPHTEIGLVLMSNEANEVEFRVFLEGLAISESEYINMKKEIDLLNFLHQLDKYRWAETYDSEHIEEHEKKVRQQFEVVRFQNE